MTKLIVAFYCLRVNGRVPEKQNRQTQEKPYPQPAATTPQTAFIKIKTKLKTKLKTGGT